MIQTRKIASLDIGLSSVMLLIASCGRTGYLEVINELGGITRLGHGISASNEIEQDKIEATLKICEELLSFAQTEGVEKVITTVASGIKKTINKTQFLVEFRNKLNVFPNILTPQEEAEMIYKGAVSEYITDERPLIVIEIGGDSTYITYGRKKTMLKSHIMKIGSFYSMDTPSMHKFKGIFSLLNPKIRSYISDEISDFRKEILSWLDGRKPLVLCSGLIASVFFSVLTGRSVLSRKSMEGKNFSIKEVSWLYHKVSRKKLEERKLIPGLAPERAQTFPDALNILYEVLNMLEVKQFTLTANGLRTGILKSYTEKITLWD